VFSTERKGNPINISLVKMTKTKEEEGKKDDEERRLLLLLLG
jgi:hypothetical protein